MATFSPLLFFSPLLLNNDDPRFQLNVENRLKNIFVTQLEDCSHLQNKEHEKNVKHIPVITESSNRILKTSVNTLQRTLVLKTQVRVVDEGDRLLEQKQLEFKDRMQNLEQKRAVLLQKQQEIKERAAKFEKFVEENEAKRCRAMKKYQVERKQNELKDKERSELFTQLEHVQLRHQNLKEKVTKYKIYEDFMMKILDLLPENHLDYGADSVVMPIIRRHETLTISQQDLLQRLAKLAEELDQSQHNLDSLRQRHNTRKLMINKELAELQTQLDQIRERNKHLEMTLHIQQGQSRYQDEETGIILIAVKNLGQQCHMKQYGPLEAMNILTIMDMIKEFILDKADTERRALKLTDSSSELTKKSGDRGRKGPSLTSNPSSVVYLKSSSKSSGGSKLLSSSKTMQ
ncbi:LOW QUALITY PROTEIN: coiled-coil domain-containing protein 42 [Trichomycterus rosablanca]|uniref:LOW QUALITY PROTEIN: coiled-coil domain-containing protein 42 n=1 Tax=Trichomycterus rosablanca TaxID=2290929 RepID=UPI002F356913